MVNIKDLRVGNKIYNQHNRIIEIDFPTLQAIYLKRGIYSYIPLTEDLFLSFGFKKWGRDDIPSTVSFEKGILNLQKHNDNNSYGWMWEKLEENKPSSWKPKVEVKFVHQLQNLWFCLTGQELSVVANGC